MHSGRQTKPLTLFNEFYDKCNQPACIYSPAAEHHRTEVHFPSALGGRLSSLGTIPSFLVMRTHYTLNNSLSDPYKGHIIKGHGNQTSCIGSGNSAGDKLSPKTRGVARSLDTELLVTYVYRDKRARMHHTTGYRAYACRRLSTGRMSEESGHTSVDRRVD